MLTVQNRPTIFYFILNLKARLTSPTPIPSITGINFSQNLSKFDDIAITIDRVDSQIRTRVELWHSS